jgi:hypothetical protein
MDFANLRRQGVRHLIAYCLNDGLPALIEPAMASLGIPRYATHDDIRQNGHIA